MPTDQDLRLPAPYGTLIDRTRTISFRFNGNTYRGYAGDTIASALAANGVRVISRSFKYHRPRGIHSLTGHDGHVLVQIGPEPNVRADSYPIEPGLVVHPQNVFGSLDFDAARILEFCSRFLPVGFYYHAFYRPRGAWRWWEPLIRRFAGLGRVERSAEHVTVEHLHRFADVAVIGGGAAGMSAALAAADQGAEVLLLDDGVRLGGALGYARCAVERELGARTLAELGARIAGEPRISVLRGTTCTGWFADNWLAAIGREQLYKIRAGAVVAATGTIEQPAVFRNNDAPGVMLASAAERLINLYGVRPGQRAVILTATSQGYGSAMTLLEAGVEIAAVVDLALTRAHDPLHDAVRAAGVEILYGHMLREALTRDRGHRLAAAIVGPLGDGGATRTLPCDLICMSAGLLPAAQLLTQAGGNLVMNADGSGLLAQAPAGQPSALAAGAVNGHTTLAAALADGRAAGWLAAAAVGISSGTPPPAADRDDLAQGHPWPIARDPRGREFVDFDEDLQIADIDDAVAAGYTDLNLVKRYSTAVMGPSQGRYSALNTLRIADRAQGRNSAGARLTTQRPPFLPEPIAHLAGRDRQPLRRTPIHAWHLAHDAHMIPAGTWLRPAYYGARHRGSAAAAREASVVHQRVGLIDVSTLGKLEIRGPDAAEFLERIYTTRLRQQAVGRLRYVLMTDEAGVITDDGIAARFGPEWFYVTATTTGVDAVYRQMLRWNAQWRLDIDIVNVTSAYCAINVAGPAARTVLEYLVDDIDLGREHFGFSECRLARVGGVSARLLRVGFVGELGWEVHAPAHHGDALWRALMTAGSVHGIAPIGIEAQRLLRLEKAHIIVSQDTDGLTYPAEAALDWAVADDKAFFVGQRALAAMTRRGHSRQLIGFRLAPDAALPEESCLTLHGEEIVGRVTSVAYSAVLGQIIGLAYVAPAMAVIGSCFDIKLSGGRGRVSAEVVKRPFYDPRNERQQL